MPSETPEQRAARKAAEAASKASPPSPKAALASGTWLGPALFPRLFLLLCRLWLLVALGAQLMVFLTWVFIMIEDTHAFQRQLGTYMGNEVGRYGPDVGAGYVTNTNIPKHLGGPIFAFVFEAAMMIIIALSTCADFYFKVPLAKQLLEAFFVVGLWDDSKKAIVEYYFLIANAFLKLFIVAATGAESFSNLQPNSPELHTPLFCVYAVFILLGSIPLTIIADMFLIQHDRYENPKNYGRA